MIILSKNQQLKPGMDAPQRGAYVEIGPRGGKKGIVQMPRKGATMPPTEKPNSTYKKG